MKNLRNAVAGSVLAVWYAVLTVGVFAGGVGAHTLETADKIHISSLHHIEGDLYAFSGDLQVDGSVSGDLVCASQTVNIRGDVGGSTNAAGMNVTYSGTSVGTVRLAGSLIQIFGTSGRSLVAAGSEITVNQGAVVEEEAAIYGNIVRLNGWIKGNTSTGGASVTIAGQIDGNLHVEGEEIIIAAPAVVNGTLTYESKNRDALIVEPGAVVVGETIWKEPEVRTEDGGDVLADISFKIACLFASFFFGVVVTGFFRPYADEAFRQLKSRLTTAFAAGLVGLLALVFAVIVLFLSLLLTLVAMLLLTGDTVMVGAFILIFSILMLPVSSFATVVGGIIFYSAVILVGYLVGHGIRALLGREPVRLSAGTLLIGLVVLSLAFWIPFYVGTLLWILVSILGAGAIILGIKNCRREAVALRVSTGESDPTPPPVE